MKKLLIGALLLGSITTYSNVFYLPKYLVCKNNVCTGSPVNLTSKFIMNNSAKIIPDGTYEYWYTSMSNTPFAFYFNEFNPNIMLIRNPKERLFMAAAKYPGNKWNGSQCPGNVTQFGENDVCPFMDFP